MKRYPFFAVLVVLAVLAGAFLLLPENGEPAIEGADDTGGEAVPDTEDVSEDGVSDGQGSRTP